MANTCVVMFNEADICDSLAFVGWGCFKTYIRDKIATDEKWRDKAAEIYTEHLERIMSDNLITNFSVYDFEKWATDTDIMSLSEIFELCAYFGYSAVEEIEFPNW